MGVENPEKLKNNQNNQNNQNLLLEKNVLLRLPLFEKTKPYIWIKAVLPEKDEYQDIYRISFNLNFLKLLNINLKIIREDLDLLQPYFKIDIDKAKNFVMVLPKKKYFQVNKIEQILQLNILTPTSGNDESKDYLKIDKYKFENLDATVIITNRVINGLARNPCLIFVSQSYTWETFLNKLNSKLNYKV